MDIPSTRLRSPRTAKVKAANALRTVPTALLLRKKAECDAKALKIVERMTEPEVDVDWLLKSLSQLNKSHMEDVSEERSIVKLCGYVLCDKPLTKVVTKRYQISTLRNKIYDVSRVKNYCSYGCYKAAEYLMEQMLTGPLWLRDLEEIPEFRILPKKSKDPRSASPPGVEIDLTGVRLPEDTEDSEEKPESEVKKTRENCSSRDEQKIEKSNLAKVETYATTSEEIFKREIESTISSRRIEESGSAGTSHENLFRESSKVKVEETINSKEGERNLTRSGDENSVPVSRDVAESSKSPDVTVDASVSMPLDGTSERAKRERGKQKKSRKGTISFDTLTSRVEKSFKEWITDETVRLLHGEANEKQKIFESVNREEKYAVLCKKLNHLQLEEEREANEIIGQLKPAPNFSALQEEAKGLELKVRAFWEGKTSIDREAGKIENSTKEREDEKVETILPLLDLHAPNALRRRIFLEKLNKVLPDLLRLLAGSGERGAAQYSYTSERCATVRALVSTFSLSATNITFKTAEWTMVGLIIIKLLGLIDPRMKYLLGSKQATMYVSMILMSYKLESNYLENFVETLTGPPNPREIEERDS